MRRSIAVELFALCMVIATLFVAPLPNTPTLNTGDDGEKITALDGGVRASRASIDFNYVPLAPAPLESAVPLIVLALLLFRLLLPNFVLLPAPYVRGPPRLQRAYY